MSIDPAIASVAFSLAIVVFVLTRMYLIDQLSNVRPEATANAYLDENSFHLTDQNDTFLYTNVTRTPKTKRRNDDD